MEKEKLKILLLDIETSPWKAECYGNMYEPVVMRITDFSQILSVALRWYGNSKCEYIGQNELRGYKKGKLNDKKLLIKLSEYIKKADYIVAHNGDKFDWLIIKERIMFHRLPPLPEVPTLDTKKLMSQNSKLPSNKLNIVSVFLGNGKKLEHGESLFSRCQDGDPTAWKINKKYNIQDVNIMYDDFEDIIPYVKLPNTYSRMDGININCSNPLCLSKHLIKSKLRRTINGWKQQYQCVDCGKYTTDNRIIRDNSKLK